MLWRDWLAAVARGTRGEVRRGVVQMQMQMLLFANQIQHVEFEIKEPTKNACGFLCLLLH